MDNGGEEAGNHLEGEGHAVRLGGGVHDESLPTDRLFIYFLVYLYQH